MIIPSFTNSSTFSKSSKHSPGLPHYSNVQSSFVPNRSSFKRYNINKTNKNQKTVKNTKNKFKHTYYNSAYTAHNYYQLLHLGMTDKIAKLTKNLLDTNSSLQFKPVNNSELNILLRELNLIHSMHYSADQLLYVKAGINDQIYDFCVDTGAAVSIIGRDFLPLLEQLNVRPFPSVLRTATSTPVEVFGRVNLPIVISDKTYYHDFVLASTPKNFLGADFLNKYNLWVNISLGVLMDNAQSDIPSFSNTTDTDSAVGLVPITGDITSSNVSDKVDINFMNASTNDFVSTNHANFFDVNNIDRINNSVTTSHSVEDFNVNSPTISTVSNENQVHIAGHDCDHDSMNINYLCRVLHTTALNNHDMDTTVSWDHQQDVMIPIPIFDSDNITDFNATSFNHDRNHDSNEVNYDADLNHGDSLHFF